jgi:hypothetical protein
VTLVPIPQPTGDGPARPAATDEAALAAELEELEAAVAEAADALAAIDADE